MRELSFLSSLFFLLIFSCAPLIQAEQLYVRATASSNTGNCHSQDLPCATLAYAISQLTSLSDPENQIMILESPTPTPLPAVGNCGLSLAATFLKLVGSSRQVTIDCQHSARLVAITAGSHLLLSSLRVRNLYAGASSFNGASGAGISCDKSVVEIHSCEFENGISDGIYYRSEEL